MVARPGLFGHVIYDGGVRRITSILVGALAFIALTAGASVMAQSNPPEPLPTTTTTGEVVQPSPTTTTRPTTTTTTTAKSSSTTNTTSGGTGAKPPPASGASQPLDPSLLGGAPIPTIAVSTSTSVVDVPPLVIHTPTTLQSNAATVIVNAKKDPPPGSTMILATVAWLASLGGLLVYMEDKRGQRWRHLAR